MEAGPCFFPDGVEVRHLGQLQKYLETKGTVSVVVGKSLLDIPLESLVAINKVDAPTVVTHHSHGFIQFLNHINPYQIPGDFCYFQNILAIYVRVANHRFQTTSTQAYVHYHPRL